ncbi:hypothetical protein NMY22_g19402 [Coprinellus aureogranulatus]|nr:hypothetical protein NMY22_g19402 [Coprinellus aureogranulatus]
MRREPKLAQHWQYVNHEDAQPPQGGVVQDRPPEITSSNDGSEGEGENDDGGDVEAENGEGKEENEGEDDYEGMDVPSHYPWEQQPAHFVPRTSTPLSHLEAGGTGGVVLENQRQERGCEVCRQGECFSNVSRDYRECPHFPCYSDEDNEDNEDDGDDGRYGDEGGNVL